jgi:iron complex outermembrane receptor protein
MKLFIAALFAVFCMAAKAQNTLSGKISDSSEALPGAIVYIPELKQGASTNKDGVYHIDHLPSGIFLVEIKFLGYATHTARVEIKGSTLLDVKLEHSATEIGEVIITGVSVFSVRKLDPVPTLVINREFLQQATQTNIIDAIARKPGISQITTGSAISKPLIRGLGYNRVVTLNNGIRHEGQQWGDEHGIEIDEYSIDRVEIIKGPGSLMYGSDAMAGVINFLLPDPVEKGKITGSVIANYQTNSGMTGYSAMNAGNINGYNWQARVSGKQSGNFSNRYDGKVYNSGFDEMDISAYLGLNRKWGYSQLHVSTFNQDVGLVEGERDSSGKFMKQVSAADSVSLQTVTASDLEGYNPGIPRQTINHFRLASISNFVIGKSALKVNLAFQQNRRREFGDVLQPDEPGLYFMLNTVNYDFKYIFPRTRSWESTLGLNGMYQANSNKGREFIIPAYDLFDAGVFAFAKRSFGKFHFSGGIRGDTRHLEVEGLILDSMGNPLQQYEFNSYQKFSAGKLNFTNFSGSAGGSYTFTSKLTGKLNTSRGYRAPNISELTSNGRHEGTFRYESGRRDLKPETSLQSDAGLLFNSAHITLELAAFYNLIQNYIFTEKILNAAGGDSIADPSDPAPVFVFVQGNAALYGGEVSIDMHPHPLDWLHFQNSFSFVRGTQPDQPDSMKNLPFMPAPKLQSEVRATIKKAGKRLKSIFINAELDYFFRQDMIYAAYGTETETPGYMLLNAGIGTDVIKRNGKTLCSVYLMAANLTNTVYQSHLSRLKYAPENPVSGRMGVFNMGRNLSFKIIVPVSFGQAGKL